MALLSSVTRGAAIAMVFLPTILVAWLSGGETFGSDNFDDYSDEDIIDVVTTEHVFFEILDPIEIGYTYRIQPARDFGAPFNASFSERNIGLVPVEPSTGCRRPDNADRLKDKVALVVRGDCTYYEKAVIAEEAGAKAIIVADYVVISMDVEREMSYWNDHSYVAMARDDKISHERNVTIPAGFLLGKNGRMIISTLKRLEMESAIINIPVNLTFASLEDFHQPPWLSL